MPSPIEEICATTRPLVLDDLMGRARPLVIRGACRDWPMVAWARESDTAFARGLAAHDSGGDVDALLRAPAEQGVIGYNDAFDGFNFRDVVPDEALDSTLQRDRRRRAA